MIEDFGWNPVNIVRAILPFKTIHPDYYRQIGI